VIDAIANAGEALTAVQAQGRQPYLTQVGIEAGATEPHTPICLAMDLEAVQMHVAPGEHDLQRVVEGGQGHVATDKQATPDQRANALQDNTEL
jgi:hypothetical protein